MRDLGPVDIRALAKAVLAIEWPEPPLLRHSSNINVEEYVDIRAAAKPIEDLLVQGPVIKRMITCLYPGQFNDLHTDWTVAEPRHRIQIPITSTERAWFYYETERFNLQVGRAYEIDPTRLHGVVNQGPVNRIHYIFDWVEHAIAKTN